MIIGEDKAFNWAIEFDSIVKNCILQNDIKSLIDYKNFGELAKLSIPTNDHYLPMLYILGVKEKNDNLRFFCEKITMGSLAMRGFLLE